MAQPLTSEEEIRYTEIIDGILATADLETVTRKKIRLGLQAELGGKDLNEQRVTPPLVILPWHDICTCRLPEHSGTHHYQDAIKALIEQRFDAISSAAAPADTVAPDSNAPLSPPNGYTNGHDGAIKDEDDVNGGEIKVSTQPPKKKQRKEQSTDTEDADARLAALLQAEENQRTRTTRGGGAKAAPKKKKKPATKKKSEKRVRPEDDSDVDGSDEPSPKKRKAGGGFQKPFNLSYPLAELCGESQLSRPQVVKKLWAHIKEKQLQDPNDGRQILCDESMQAVFKMTKVDMFQMNKLVGNHLYPVEEGA
ncbi:DEK C terminal domain-containing protein [Xylaria acuta]|nr:DEK C terminal domain-containing protein [Xylaria acuta]